MPRKFSNSISSKTRAQTKTFHSTFSKYFCPWNNLLLNYPILVHSLFNILLNSYFSFSFFRIYFKKCLHTHTYSVPLNGELRMDDWWLFLHLLPPVSSIMILYTDGKIRRSDEETFRGVPLYSSLNVNIGHLAYVHGPEKGRKSRIPRRYLNLDAAPRKYHLPPTPLLLPLGGPQRPPRATRDVGYCTVDYRNAVNTSRPAETG